MKTEKPINIYACHLHDGKREAIVVKDILSISDGAKTNDPHNYRVSMDVFIRPGHRHEMKKYLQPFKRLQELYTYAYGIENLHEISYNAKWLEFAYRNMSRETYYKIAKSYSRV